MRVYFLNQIYNLYLLRLCGAKYSRMFIGENVFLDRLSAVKNVNIILAFTNFSMTLKDRTDSC